MLKIVLRWACAASLVALVALLGCGAMVVIDETGECAPRTFLGDLDGGSAAAADGHYGFWSSQEGSLYRVDLESNAVVPLVKSEWAQGETYVGRPIAVADGFVYFTYHGGFFRAPTDGGGPELLVPLSSEQPIALRVVGDYLDALNLDGSLTEVHLSTGEVRSSGALSSLGESAHVVTELAVDAENIYVIASFTDHDRLLKVSRVDFSTEVLVDVVFPSQLIGLQRVERGLLFGSYDRATTFYTLSLVSLEDGTTTDLVNAVLNSAPGGLVADEAGIFVVWLGYETAMGLWFSWDDTRSAALFGDQTRWGGTLAGVAVADRWVFLTVDPPGSSTDPVINAMAICKPSEAR